MSVFLTTRLSTAQRWIAVTPPLRADACQCNELIDGDDEVQLQMKWKSFPCDFRKWPIIDPRGYERLLRDQSVAQ